MGRVAVMILSKVHKWLQLSERIGGFAGRFPMPLRRPTFLHAEGECLVQQTTTFTSRGDCDSPHPPGIDPAFAHQTKMSVVTGLLRPFMHQGHQSLLALVYPHL